MHNSSLVTIAQYFWRIRTCVLYGNRKKINTEAVNDYPPIRFERKFPIVRLLLFNPPCRNPTKSVPRGKAIWNANGGFVSVLLTHLLFFYYPPFASIAKGEVFGLLYVCLFVNDFSTTRGPIHAKVRMQASSDSGCVFSPFGGWRPPAGGKRGKWNFRYYGSRWGIFAFWRFLRDISATLAWIHTKYYLCRDNVCRRAPSPCGAHRPLGGGGRGS